VVALGPCVRDHHGAESGRSAHPTRRANMSVYRVIDVVGTSTTSWEEAAADAINTARQSVRDLRVAEVVKQDIHVGDGGELIYRTKIQLSFKYESHS
jgi:dodecin